MDDERDLERDLLAREWFYPFQLPSGAVTPTYGGPAIDLIHTTRLAMMDAALAPHFPNGLPDVTAVDMACHQGWFSIELAKRGCREVIALDARAEHIEDVQTMTSAMGISGVVPVMTDIHEATPERFGTHEIVLCFGLIYHLENPVGALRVARSLCSRMCLVETQVVPNMAGPIDWGGHEWVRPLEGVFGIIDEADAVAQPQASTTGICLAPSLPGLLWVLRHVGFNSVDVIPVPPDGYEQLRHGKRVMVAAVV